MNEKNSGELKPDVRIVGAQDWRVWRDLRLEGLADTPIGFAELHADALAKSDEAWMDAMQWPGLRLMAFAGPDPDARPWGLAGGFHRGDVPILFGVYVRPAVRGRGVLEALVEVVRAWAAPDALTLDVHEDNHRAHAAYLRLGFADTGERTSGGGIDGRDLLRMRAR